MTDNQKPLLHVVDWDGLDLIIEDGMLKLDQNDGRILHFALTTKQGEVDMYLCHRIVKGLLAYCGSQAFLALRVQPEEIAGAEGRKLVDHLQMQRMYVVREWAMPKPHDPARKAAERALMDAALGSFGVDCIDGNEGEEMFDNLARAGFKIVKAED